jgi:hypothetical protein
MLAEIAQPKHVEQDVQNIEMDEYRRKQAPDLPVKYLIKAPNQGVQ